MMMIGPLIMGTTAAAAGDFTGFTKTPQPMYVNGKWWSFTSKTRISAPTVGIVSQVSVDNGVTWTEDNVTWDTSFVIGLDEMGHGILAGSNSFDIVHKDLGTPSSSWVTTDVSNLPGGFTSTGGGVLTYDHFNDNFILTKGNGSDIYTSTDCVTYTPINGVVANTLTNEMVLILYLIHNGSEYVAYGKLGNSFRISTSPDLLAWTPAVTEWEFEDIRKFAGIWIAIRDIGAAGLILVYTSSDFITWTNTFTAQSNFSDVPNFEYALVTDTHYMIVSNSSIFHTTDGITFIEVALPFNIALDVPEVTPRAKLIKSSTGDAPPIIIMATVDHEELGGKLVSWSSLITDAPNLTYPVGDPYAAKLGFAGQAATTGAGISNQGFNLTGIDGPQGLYQNKTDIRYFELTVLIADDGAQVGVTIPFPAFLPGGLSEVLLTFNSVKTNSGDLGVAYNMEIGQILGFKVDFILAQITIYVDNEVLVVLPNVVTSNYWTQSLDMGTVGSINMNVGQDPFIYTIPDTIAWGDPYV